MMKKLWDLYSYAIILFILSLLITIIIAFRFGDSNYEQYMVITVNEGDSLWKIAENLSSNHTMTSQEFVKWVEKNNNIYDNRIYPGDELMIPVVVNSSAVIEYASVK